MTKEKKKRHCHFIGMKHLFLIIKLDQKITFKKKKEP